MTFDTNLLELTSDIVSSHVTNNSVPVSDLPNLIRQVHHALSGLGQEQAEPERAKRTPIVSARASIKQDYLVCLECGKKQKTLKRHLQNAHQLTPAEYRSEFELAADYPMVAPAYSARRSDMAKAIGLGRRTAAETAPQAEAAPKKRRGPKPKAAAEG
jgi:predicted transcriptional regulator